MRKFFITIFAYFIYLIVRLTGKLPDKVIIFFIDIIKPVNRIFSKDDDPDAALMELREVFTDFPGGSEMVKNIIRESRPSQLISTLRGMLRHHVFEESRLSIPADPLAKKLSSKLKKRERQTTVAFFMPRIDKETGYDQGCALDYSFMQEAYNKHPNFSTFVLNQNGESKEDLLQGVDVLEIGSIEGESGALAATAIGKGIIVSVHYSCISSAKDLQELWQAAVKARKKHLLRVLYPPLYYAPVQALKHLISKKELGETAIIRIQALLGGEGGTASPEKPGEKGFFAHYAFNHFLLLSYLGGPLESSMDYLSPANQQYPMDHHNGRQGIVSVKFKDAGRYGMLECAHAPQMHIKSSQLPSSISIEVAGTDGISWANGASGELSQGPPLWVRVGKRSYPAGIETGMPCQWESVYEKITAHTISMLNGKRYQIVDVPFVIETLSVANRHFTK